MQAFSRQAPLLSIVIGQTMAAPIQRARCKFQSKFLCGSLLSEVSCFIPHSHFDVKRNRWR